MFFACFHISVCTLALTLPPCSNLQGNILNQDGTTTRPSPRYRLPSSQQSSVEHSIWNTLPDWKTKEAIILFCPALEIYPKRVSNFPVFCENDITCSPPCSPLFPVPPLSIPHSIDSPLTTLEGLRGPVEGKKKGVPDSGSAGPALGGRSHCVSSRIILSGKGVSMNRDLTLVSWSAFHGVLKIILQPSVSEYVSGEKRGGPDMPSGRHVCVRGKSCRACRIFSLVFSMQVENLVFMWMLWKRGVR